MALVGSRVIAGRSIDDWKRHGIEEGIMLVIALREGESLLAEGLWELRFKSSDPNGFYFELESLRRCVYTVCRKPKQIAAGTVMPRVPSQFTVSAGSRVIIGSTEIHISLHEGRFGTLKLGIEPEAGVKYNRPAQHGTCLVPG